MSFHSYKLRRKRDGYLPASGSIVESVPSPTASWLEQNTAVPAASSPPIGIPLVSTSPSDSTPTFATQSPTPTSSANSSASSASQISMGTVIGACIAALVVLLLAVSLAVYCSKRQKQTPASLKSRNAANDASRRQSHLEYWKRMADDEGRWKGEERPMKQSSSSPPLGAMFHRTISNTSGEKSSDGHNRESFGTLQHFAKYHPDLAVEMASQVADAGADVAKPPPALQLIGRGLDMTPPISWDGETVGGESFTSLRQSLSNPMSPHMATAKSTPPAMVSSLHHWESAEVIHVSQADSTFGDVGELRNPFSDSASSVRSSLKGQNPFFSAQDHGLKRTLLPTSDARRNPFADASSVDESPTAIQSLIAALEEPHRPAGNDRIISVQSSAYSRVTSDDGESAISVTAFPHPPTQVDLG